MLVGGAANELRGDADAAAVANHRTFHESIDAEYPGDLR
jgi:hypothetical protein